MKGMLLGVLFMGLSAPAAAQVAQVSPDVMREFDFLIGEWSGAATFQMGPGDAATAQGTERVRKMAGGAALAVEGLFTARAPDGSERVVHNAFGVISPHPDGGYRITSWLADGGQAEAKLERTADGFRWGFEIPGGQGQVRYAMQFADGKWIEKGEFSPDGTTWYPFLEMRLERVSGD